MCFGGIGDHQLNSNIMGLIYADGIRIGLEDNLYFKNKEKTKNIDLLKRIHRIINEMGLSILTPSNFRKNGFKNKYNNNLR